MDAIDWPREIFVFGLSYVAPSFTSFFERLSEQTNLHLFTLNPCFQYWEDAQKKTLKQLKSETYVFAEPPQIALGSSDESPALNLWGRPGREYLKTLNHMRSAVVTGGFIDPLEHQHSLLAQIQHDILMRKSPQPFPTGPDTSIQFIKAADRRSEVEAVALYIEELLSTDAELTLRDVTVLICEDHKNEYLAHIEAVFWHQHHMPYNTVDRTLQSNSQVLEHVKKLLSLGVEAFQMDAVHSVLAHPLAWSEALEIKGLATRWRHELKPAFTLKSKTNDTYFGIHKHDIQSALDDFLSAVIGMPQTLPEVLNEVRTTAPNVGLSEIEQGLEYYWRLKTLVMQIASFSEASLTLEEWQVVIDDYLTANTFPETTLDEYSFEQCRAALRALAESDIVHQKLPFSAVNMLLRPKLEALTGGMGQLLASGVIVSSLLPMRILPSKVIILMGLGAGGFPGRIRLNPLDMRQRERQFGDVNEGERDRYLFLESLLSVREHLVCTYVGTHPTSGEPEAPSAVVEEFGFILESYVGEAGLNAMEITQPILPWNAEDNRTLEANKRAVMAAKLRFASSNNALPPLDLSSVLSPLNQGETSASTGTLSVAHARTTTLGPHHVSAFLKSPLQASARVRLGLFEPEMPELEGHREPLAPNYFDLSTMVSQSFWQTTSFEAAKEYLDQSLKTLQDRGRMPFGVFFDKMLRDGAETLEVWWQNADAVDLGCPSEYLTVRMGDGKLNQQTDLILAPLDIPITIDGETQDIRIEGNLQRVHREGHTIARTLLTKEATRKNLLEAFLSLVFMSAVGHPPTPVVRLAALSAKLAPRERLCQFINVPNQEQAIGYLSGLLHELLSDFHDYRLPVEAVLKFVTAREQDMHTPFTTAQADQTSDQYGPIRLPNDFEPPQTHTAVAMIERRFGAWFEWERR